MMKWPRLGQRDPYDQHCAPPYTTGGGALEVEVRDFAGTNQITSGELGAWLSPFPPGEKQVSPEGQLEEDDSLMLTATG